LDRSELAKLEEADQEPGGETAEQRNKFLVLRLYEALNGRDHAAVQDLLAPDLEWWFHGPPKHQQHMMRLLTTGGAAAAGLFRFVPRSVDAFGSTVIAESQEGSVYWVHAWTVNPDGVITQLREYFNTDLTVTRLAAATKCVWQSRRPDCKTNSLPGLLLAI
jgi:ketosteroid isomerase-like protein